MPKLSAAAMAERRLHIVRAAYRTFVAQGFAAASVDGICAEAGISKGAFYVHFKSKEALVHAVAELRAETIPPLPGDTPEALADAILDLLVGGMLDVPAARFELEAIAASIGDARLAGLLDGNLATIRARIAEGAARFSDAATAERMADAVITHCMGVVLRSASWTPQDRARLRDGLVALLS